MSGEVKVLRNHDEAYELIRKREPFRDRIRKTPYGTYCSISGYPVGTGYTRTGQLPREFVDALYRSDYAVYSYDTPIALHVNVPRDLSDNDEVERWLAHLPIDGYWLMPQVKYSITTTGHQSLVHAALGGWARPFWGQELGKIPMDPLSMASAPAKVECSVERVGW